MTLAWLKMWNEASSSGVFVTVRHAVCVAVRQTAALPAAPGAKQKKGTANSCTGAKQSGACCMNGDEKTAAS